MASMMYAIQAPAFNAAASYAPKPTNSTPDTPPTQTLDVVSACKHKIEVVSNLPKNCGHCQAPILEGYCEEYAKDIYCYCRHPSGCGRSQVLFKAPTIELTHTYEKVCVFERKPREGDAERVKEAGRELMRHVMAEQQEGQVVQQQQEEEVVQQQVSMDDFYASLSETMAPPVSEVSAMPPTFRPTDFSETMDHPSAHPPMSEMAMPPMSEMAMPPISEMAMPPMSEMAMPPISEMAMPPHVTETAMPPMSEMAMPPHVTETMAPPSPSSTVGVLAYNPEDVCAKCNKTWQDHPKDYDQNGWRIASSERVELPDDWPVWQSSTKSWKSKDKIYK